MIYTLFSLYSFNIVIIKLVIIIAIVLITLVLLLLLKKSYKHCPPYKILVVYGNLINKDYINYYHTSKFVWPLLQKSEFLDLTPHTFSLSLDEVYSKENICLSISSTATIALERSPAGLKALANHLTPLTCSNIKIIATQLVISQIHLVISQLTFENIYTHRQDLVSILKNNINQELKKVGLALITFAIINIKDKYNYSDIISKHTTLIITHKAQIDLAQKELELAEKKAELSVQSYIIEQNACREKEKVHLQTQAQHLKLEIEKCGLEVELKALQISSEHAIKKEALKLNALEKELIFESKAQGYKKIVEACNNNTESAAIFVWLDKLEKLAALQVDALKNLKIDKITLGNCKHSHEEDSAPDSLLDTLIHFLPAIKDMSLLKNIQLPELAQSVLKATQSKEKNSP